MRRCYRNGAHRTHPATHPEPYPEHMKKLAALAALPLALTACSSGSGDSASSSSSSSSAIHKDGKYDNIDALRAAIREAGVQCPDSIWKPAATPTDEYMTGDAWCGDNVRIAITKDDPVAPSGAMVAFTLDSAKKSIDSRDGYTAKYVQGDNWIVQVPTGDAQASIQGKLGGKNPAGSSSDGSTAANGPDDTGVTQYETHFVDAEREALPGLVNMSGANIKKVGDYACDQIETVEPGRIDQLVADFAGQLDDSVAWSAPEGKTFTETANREWCSDKTPAS